MTERIPRTRPTPRIRAAIVGLGLDSELQSPTRLVTMRHGLVVGGSPLTHGEIAETMAQLDLELERLGRDLSELNPTELAELAWRIDSAELMEIALRMDEGLDRAGLHFEQTDVDQRNDLAAGRPL